jgi:YVTN family beta-propeller protein
MAQRFGRLTWGWRLALYTLGALGGAIFSVTAVEAYCVYVPNVEANSISVIDTTTNALTATIEIAEGPFGHPEAPALTPDARFLYVANRGDRDHPGNTLTVIDTATNMVASTVTVTEGSGPDKTLITPNGAFAYVTGQYSGTIMVLDTAKALTDSSHAMVKTIAVPGTDELHGGVISGNGSFVYVNACASPCAWPSPTGFIAVVETSSNTLRAPVPGAWAGAITPDGKFSYGPLPFYDAVVVTDTGKALSDPDHAVSTTIPVGSFPYAVALTPDGHLAYVANCGEYCLTNDPSSVSNVSVIDTSTNKVVSTISLPPSSGPTGVAITPDGAFAYVPNGWSNNVAVIDTAKAVTDPAHAVIKNIAVAGPRPAGIAIGSVPGGCAGLNNPTPTLTPTPLVTRTTTMTVTATPPTTPGRCVGDCGSDGEVTVSELITMVNIALGTADVSTCTAGDVDGNGEITISELITAVNHALTGC